MKKEPTGGEIYFKISLQRTFCVVDFLKNLPKFSKTTAFCVKAFLKNLPKLSKAAPSVPNFGLFAPKNSP